MKKIYIIILLSVIMFSCKNKHEESDVYVNDTTKKVEIKVVETSTTQDVKKFVEPTTKRKYSKIIKMDRKAMPSYCSNKGYKIVEFYNPSTSKYMYKVQLIGGTDMNGTYNTIDAAQDRIDKAAESSFKRWVKSGGTEY